MGRSSQPITDSSDADNCRYQRVQSANRRQALSLLLNGRLAHQDPAVEQFLRFSNEQALSLDELWMAWHGATPAGAVLIVPCAGRTAMLFVSPPASWYSRKHTAQLIRTACQAIDAREVRMIQSLLDVDLKPQQQVVEQAGFEPLATLRYMTAKVNKNTPEPDLAQFGITTEPWSELNRHRFAQAILASYEQTLDCPALLGVREIDDIIAGHMAVGRFDPQMWSLLCDDHAKPVGVMLLNHVDHADGYELVYLGLDVAHRRRGLGRAMLQHAMAQAASRKRACILLAVDERNTPAVQLYEAMGFFTTARKQATMLTLA